MKEKTEKDEKKKMKRKRIKVRHPIGVKLGSIFSSLVIFVLGITVALIYLLFAKDESVTAKANTISLNETTANAVQTQFQNIQVNTTNFLNVMSFIKDDKHFDEEANYFYNELFESNPNILFIYSNEFGYRATKSFSDLYPGAKTVFEAWLKKNPTVKSTAAAGYFDILDLSDVVGRDYTLGTTFSYNRAFVCVAYDVEDLKETCFKSTIATYVVNRRGEPLIYEDNQTVLDAGLVPPFEVVEDILTNSSGSEYLFNDSNNNNWIYIRTSFLDDTCSAITLTSESDIYKAINLTALRIIAVSFAVFFLAIMIIRFFSRSLTNPIEDLVAATNSIDRGNYNIHLRPRTKDEIGYLTDRFINMAGGLEERQRLMSTFTKFVNKDIAQKAASGELTLGGEDKNATVFFSDIRSFTAMSEKMTAPQVVEFLNDYFTRMVDCVNKTNGIVDKFIGDAVMAVWGAATTNGSPEEDAWAAVKAALMMRIALYHFNENQIAHGRNPIKIGCGINSGPIVAGQIGSEDHMNYTVIGDTVNLASRTEALNKPFATDILITENTYVLVKDKIIAEEMPGVHVKGKTDPIKMYAVVNAKGVKGPKDIHKLREFLGWDEPELDKVNTDEEEKKYKIGK
ncbi:MAG: HAMP domain-containing protein [Treponema sp.]|nr:HAMP domain-containing protein [Treponema sp.]